MLHVKRNVNDQIHAVLDSIDQGASGIQVSSFSVQNSEIRSTVAAVDGSYRGKINPEETEIVGKWRQPEPLP